LAAIVGLTAPASHVLTQAAAAAKTKFDVASVRPCSPDDRVSGRGGRGGGPGPGPRTSPGRLHIVCRSLPDLIDTAYFQFGANRPVNAVDGPFGQHEEGRIRGGPAW